MKPLIDSETRAVGLSTWHHDRVPKTVNWKDMAVSRRVGNVCAKGLGLLPPDQGSYFILAETNF